MISRKERQHMRERLDDPEYRLWLVRRWRWCSVVLLPPLIWTAAWAQGQAFIWGLLLSVVCPLVGWFGAERAVALLRNRL